MFLLSALRRLGGVLAASLTLAACGSSIPVDLQGVVPEAGAIAGGTFDGATWAVFTDESQRRAGSAPHCVAVMSDLDVGVATKCNDPTVDAMSGVAVPISEGRVLIAGWTSPEARTVSTRSGVRYHSLELAPTRDGIVSTFAFIIDESFDTFTAEDADGARLAFRTADDLCRGRC